MIEISKTGSSETEGGGFQRRHNLFGELCEIENIFDAWHEFKQRKEKKRDVQLFALEVEDQLFDLQRSVACGEYMHGEYASFFVHDPKKRHIHKATVRDRVLHQAIFRVLMPLFEPSFVFDSFSSRLDKGTHRAVARLRQLAWTLSRNNTRTVWALQGDIRKYFDSIDHAILIALLQKKIVDPDMLDTIQRVIASFESSPGKGLPLGNVTSQLFSNVYLNPFDQWMQRAHAEMKYLRYADDFVVLSCDKQKLVDLISSIEAFLRIHLELCLHPNKIQLRAWHQGIDFLGYVSFPRHQILRTKTKHRMVKRISMKNAQSYLGMLSHCAGTGIVRTLISRLFSFV